VDFEDKVIIVSGGSSGMGRATATLLGQAGARVVLADIDVDAGRRVADSIGDRATLVETDLRSLESIRSLVAGTEERFGRIDGLANVAAV
jgi:NAD(P)-dependent dehydrogenase (short-subunit alcohol dehydrogenase family)